MPRLAPGEPYPTCKRQRSGGGPYVANEPRSRAAALAKAKRVREEREGRPAVADEHGTSEVHAIGAGARGLDQLLGNDGGNALGNGSRGGEVPIELGAHNADHQGEPR